MRRIAVIIASSLLAVAHVAAQESGSFHQAEGVSASPSPEAQSGLDGFSPSDVFSAVNNSPAVPADVYSAAQAAHNSIMSSLAGRVAAAQAGLNAFVAAEIGAAPPSDAASGTAPDTSGTTR